MKLKKETLAKVIIIVLLLLVLITYIICYKYKQENNIIIVVTFEGKYYQALLDTKHGGDCQINGEIDLKI